MNTSGLTVPPAVNGFQWEQCPDLDARQVFRLVGSDALWIVWQSNRYQAISAMSDDRSSIPSWHRISAETIAGELGGLPIAYLASSANLSKATWLAVQLVSISTLDQLIERFGQPPVEVQQDWTRQSRALSGKMVFGSNQLSHVIAMTDGRLISLLAIEAFLTRLDSSSVACIPMEFPLPALEERLQGLATRTDGYFQKTIDELLRVSSPSTAKADAKPSKNIKQSLLDPNEVKKSSKVATTSKPRSRKIRWGAVAAFGVLLVGVWTMLSLSRPKPVAQNNGTESTEPSTPIAELPSESLEAEFDSDVKLQLSPREPDPIGESLSEKANDSLSKILSGFGGSSNSDAIESISFESVEAILKNTDEAKIIEQSLGQSADGKSIEMQATTAPFGEPLDAPMAPEAADSSASTNATGTEPSNDIKSDVGFLTQSLSIKQALYKTTLKLPFKPNDRKAVCRVQLKLAADLLQKPVEAVELVGPQDTVWNVALQDDNASLAIYLRSKPARSWYLATAVRLKMSPNVEFPIDPHDPTQVCKRLQNYLRFLDQNRQLGESMRSNKKTRSMAMAGLDEIQRQTKATETSLKKWIAIESLVRAFYSENAIEIEMASSSEELPH